MKSVVFLTAFLGGFCYLTYQISFWFAIGATYLVGMGLVALIAFTTKKSAKISMGCKSFDRSESERGICVDS